MSLAPRFKLLRSLSLAFAALAAGSADSVILTTLVPGTYSALMSATDARSGVDTAGRA